MPSGPALVLAVHLVFVGLLALVSLVLFAVPSGGGDCCLPLAVLGVVTLGELILVLGAVAIAGATGRHTPLVIVDAIVTAPFLALVPGMFIPRTGPESLLPPIILALLVVGLASAILAARVVREHRTERMVLAGALVLVIAFLSAAPGVTIVPILALAATLFPHFSPHEPVPGSPEPAHRTAVRMVGNRGAPDATGILARREGERPPAADRDDLRPEDDPGRNDDVGALEVGDPEGPGRA